MALKGTAHCTSTQYEAISISSICFLITVNMVRGGSGLLGVQATSFDHIFLKPENSYFFPRPQSSTVVGGRPSTSQGFFQQRPATPGRRGGNFERPPSKGGDRPPSRRGGSGRSGDCFEERPPSRPGSRALGGMQQGLPREESLGGGLERPKSAVNLGAGGPMTWDPISGFPVNFGDKGVPGLPEDHPLTEKLPPRPKSSDGRMRPKQVPIAAGALGGGGDGVFSAPAEDPRQVFRPPPSPQTPPSRGRFPPGVEKNHRGRPKSSPAGATRPKDRPGAWAAAVRAPRDPMKGQLYDQDPGENHDTGVPPPANNGRGGFQSSGPSPGRGEERLIPVLREDPFNGKVEGGTGEARAALRNHTPWVPSQKFDHRVEGADHIGGGAHELTTLHNEPEPAPEPRVEDFDISLGLADLLKDPPTLGGTENSTSGAVPRLCRSASQPGTISRAREERFAEKEQWRILADIPTQEDFPHSYCLGWDAKRPSQPPIYTLDPTRHTVDKFVLNKNKRNAMEKFRTNRYKMPTEASITDTRMFNRMKGVCEYQDLIRPTNERLNRAHHRQMNKNEKVFRQRSGATTCFVDLMIKQGTPIYRAGTRMRT